MPVNDLMLLAKAIHEENAHWWRNPATGERIQRNKAQTLFLIVSEITEAGEAERKGLMDDHLPHRRGPEVELADALIRMFDYAGAHNYDLDQALRKSYPNILAKTLRGLQRHFAYRSFNRAGNKPEQLMLMIMTLSRIAELEIGGSPARDVESQLAWFLGLVCDYASVWDYDLEGAMYEKRAYNRTRFDHTDAARLAAGGKKW